MISPGDWVVGVHCGGLDDSVVVLCKVKVVQATCDSVTSVGAHTTVEGHMKGSREIPKSTHGCKRDCALLSRG